MPIIKIISKNTLKNIKIFILTKNLQMKIFEI